MEARHKGPMNVTIRELVPDSQTARLHVSTEKERSVEGMIVDWVSPDELRSLSRFFAAAAAEIEGRKRPATRVAAYEAIDSERDYHDQLGPDRSGIDVLSPSEELRLIRQIVRDADKDWYKLPGHANDLDYIRKIAGCAVRCMENHGAPKREA